MERVMFHNRISTEEVEVARLVGRALGRALYRASAMTDMRHGQYPVPLWVVAECVQFALRDWSEGDYNKKAMATHIAMAEAMAAVDDLSPPPPRDEDDLPGA